MRSVVRNLCYTRLRKAREQVALDEPPAHLRWEDPPMTTRHRSALQHMEGCPFPVLNSTGGGRPRVARVAVRLERTHRYLRSVLEFDPRIRLLVLSTEDWANHADFPLYGMPHYTEEGEIIVGDEPADFWQGVTLMLDSVLTRAQRAEAEATYGTVDGRIDMAPFAALHSTTA